MSSSQVKYMDSSGMEPYPEYKDSGVEWIGEIPQHWDVVQMKYLIKVINGNGFAEELQGRSEGHYPFFKVSDINSQGVFVTTAKNHVTKQDIIKYRWNIIPSNSIIVPKIGEALKKNHRKINKNDCLIDNNIMALKPKKKNELNIDYLYYLFCIIDMEWYGTVSYTHLTLPTNREV